MANSQKRIELLVPAKNAEIGIAAINCGADAVYISAQQFGAREGAENSVHDIEKLVSYAHKFYARIYIALNTILSDNELPEAEKLINVLYSIGADGLIIQDVGLLELELPPIPLIASTQMHNNSVEKISFLEKVGFNRVILPRELTLNEIKKIRNKTTIELECFIHGALCVSYSGQCYMSYAIGGRSANRGRCAQACRRLYSLCDTNRKILVKDRHILSLKDLNRSEYLKDLINAGVASFKIEGRLKDLPYVVNTTSFYRKKLDELIDGKNIFRNSSGTTSFNFSPNPYKTFNRGFTDYGITGKNINMASIYTPKSTGERIGTVESISRDYFVLSSNYDLQNGDGLCFFDSDKILRGTIINKAEDGKIYPDKIQHIQKGTIIFRNYDRMFVKTIEKSPYKRNIEIHFSFEESSGGFKLNIYDENGNTGESFVPSEKIIAEKKEQARSTIEKQLLKLNDTIFACKSLTINLKEIYFIKVSILNQLRRAAVINLLEVREKNRPKLTGHILVNNIPYFLKTLSYQGNVLNKKAEVFYRRHGVKAIEPAAESGLDMTGRVVMITKYCIKKELGFCKKYPPGAKVKEPLYLIDEYKRMYLLQFNCKNCSMEIYFGKK